MQSCRPIAQPTTCPSTHIDGTQPARGASNPGGARPAAGTHAGPACDCPAVNRMYEVFPAYDHLICWEDEIHGGTGPTLEGASAGVSVKHCMAGRCEGGRGWAGAAMREVWRTAQVFMSWLLVR